MMSKIGVYLILIGVLLASPAASWAQPDSCAKQLIQSATGPRNTKAEEAYSKLKLPGTRIDTKPGKLLLFSESEELLGHIEYALVDSGNRMIIQHIYTDPSVRRQGISKLLLSRLLADHPQVRTIEAELGFSNWEVFEAAISKKKSPLEAAKETFLYRAIKDLDYPHLKARTRDGFTDDATLIFEKE